ncbi:MAG: autotransporter-associated beta strand repeat-containing protein [Verrucomicrobia bacterium]|nr:autotransporter-associated beta strand repeat-containing protein [Verrucomicrobiota bacterium]
MKPKHKTILTSVLPAQIALGLGLAVVGIPSQSALGAALTWTGTTGSVWNSAASWNPAQAPTSADDLAILGPLNVAGALTINVNTAAAANTINFTNTSATALTNTSSGANQTLTLQSGLTVGTGAVTIGSATANQNVNIALGASQTWDIGSGGLTAVNVISGTGFQLTKNGTGTLTLSGANTYSGNTVLNAGTLSVGSNSGLGTGMLNLGGGTLLIGQNLTVNNNIVLNGTATIQKGTTALNNSTLGGGISGSGNLTLHAGVGGSERTLWLSGANTMTSGTITTTAAATSGIVRINSTSAGNANVAWVFNDAATSLDLTGSATIQFGSMTGTGNLQGNTAGTKTAEVGALGQNDLMSGAIVNGTGAIVALTKVGTGTLTLAGANTYTGATTISAGTLQIGNGGATGSLGTTAITNDATLAFNRTGTVTQASAISGIGNLIQAGTGTLVLTGTNTYTGATTISAGTLQIGDGGTTGSLSDSSAITNNATLAFKRSDTIYQGTDFASVISGSGSLTKAGAGTLDLSGSNTYTGATTINAGTVSVSGSISASTTTVNNGGTLTGTGTVGNVTLATGGQIGAGADAASVGTLTGTSLTIGGGTGYAFTLDNVNASVAGTDYDQIVLSGGLTLNNTSGSPFTISLYGTPAGWSNSGNYSWDIISASSLTGFSAANFTTNFSNFGITSENRTGTWSFSNPSPGVIRLSYTAAAAASVWAGGTGVWSSGFSPAVVNGAVASFTGGGGTATNNIASGTLSSLSSITFDAAAGAYTLDANVGSAGASGGTPLVFDNFIANNSSNAQTINLDLSLPFTRSLDATSGDIILGGVVSGNGGILKTGNSALTLSGNNTYSGATTISAGNFEIASSGRLGGGSYSADIANSGTFIYSGTNNQTLSGIISGTGALTHNASSTLTLAGINTYTGGTSVNGGTLEIGGSGLLGSGAYAGAIATSSGATFQFSSINNQTISGVVSGGGALDKSGPGILTLSNANNYSGGTVLNAGTLAITNSTALGTGAVTLAGGILTSAATAADLFMANNIVVNGTAAITRDASSNKNYTLNGTISGSGNLTLNTGASVNSLYLAGANTMTSGTITYEASTAGIVRISTVNAGNANVAWVFNRLANFDLGAGTRTIQFGSLSGTGGLAGNTAGTLTIEVGNLGLNDTYSGQITNGAGVSVLGLTKVGTGTLTLTAGNNNYTGGTVVQNGTLNATFTNGTANAIFSAVPAGQAVSVASGAALVLTLNGTRDAFLNQAITGSGATTVTTSGADNRFLNITSTLNNRFSSAGDLTVESVGTGTIGLNLFGTNQTIGALKGGNLAIITTNGNGTTSTLTIGNNNNSGTYSGQLAQGGGAYILAITKVGTGTQTLTGTNTYTGDTTVEAGILAVGGTAIADGNKLVIYGGKVEPTGTEVVNTLYFGTTQQAAGTWGATGSGATHIDDVHFSGTSGVVSVTSGPAGYAGWAATEGLTVGVNDGANDDPDGDGIANLLEYVLGGHPIGAGASDTSILPTQALDATNLTLTFERSDLSEIDTTQTIQISTGLGTWTDFATIGATSSGAVTVTENSPTAELDTVSVAIPRSNAVNGKLFARLKVIKN